MCAVSGISISLPLQKPVAILKLSAEELEGGSGGLSCFLSNREHSGKSKNSCFAQLENMRMMMMMKMMVEMKAEP
ncbi:hypothetical protein GJAV_G00106030 [Gymnothorax javanicus]|nr:hypothetical protein GJAV_G00106030 [Gymnothorax javanicus]